MDRNLGALAGFLVTALALAGCTAPAAEAPTAPAKQTALAPVAAVAAPVEAAAEPLPQAPLCPVVEERTSEARVEGTVLTVEGCIAVYEPQELGGLPRDPRVEFDVGQGIRAMRLQYHLHGPEPLEVTLRDPLGALMARQGAQGDRDRDSFVLLEVEAPKPGRWSLEVAVGQLVLARGWTAVVVLAAP